MKIHKIKLIVIFVGYTCSAMQAYARDVNVYINNQTESTIIIPEIKKILGNQEVLTSTAQTITPGKTQKLGSIPYHPGGGILSPRGGRGEISNAVIALTVALPDLQKPLYLLAETRHGDQHRFTGVTIDVTLDKNRTNKAWYNEPFTKLIQQDNNCTQHCSPYVVIGEIKKNTFSAPDVYFTIKDYKG